MYLSISGVVTTLFVVRALASPSIKGWMQELENEGIVTVIRTVDSFLTKDFICRAFGVDKSRICCGFFFLCALCHCLAAVLRGAGKAFVPMAAMLACWCLIRVTILFIFVPILGTIDIVNWVYPITWFLCASALVIYYFTADWAGQRVASRV